MVVRLRDGYWLMHSEVDPLEVPMKSWTYAGVLVAAPLLAGCGQTQSAPPPIEEKSPPKTETATFSLG